MTTKSAVTFVLGIPFLVLAIAANTRAHEVLGVPSYHACQSTLARAFLRSPNPGATNRDYPLDVVDASGNRTGEHIVVITLENDSDFDARVTALGFAWGGAADRVELVQLQRSYNELTTNNAGERRGMVGPDDYVVVPSFALALSPSVEFSVRQSVRGVPGFPHTSLDFALVTGNTFSGGDPEAGLANDNTRHQIAFKTTFPNGSGLPLIETLLNDSYVRFRHVGLDAEGSETGIWRNLLPAVSCP